MSPNRIEPSSPRDREKRAVGIWVDPRIDTAVEHLKADTRLTKSEIYELGARIVVAIAKAKRVPDDLGEVLARFDPEALELLQQLVSRLG